MTSQHDWWVTHFSDGTAFDDVTVVDVTRCARYWVRCVVETVEDVVTAWSRSGIIVPAQGFFNVLVERPLYNLKDRTTRRQAKILDKIV